MSDVLGDGAAEPIATSFLGMPMATGHVVYGGELRGVAKAAGMTLGQVVVLQLAYEAFAACMGVVAGASPGAAFPRHIGTMDWDMAALERLTLEVDFVKAGAVVFSATTWAGYVGVLTVVRGGRYSAGGRAWDRGVPGWRAWRLECQDGAGGIGGLVSLACVTSRPA